MLSLGNESSENTHLETVERVVERARALLARVDDCTHDTQEKPRNVFVNNVRNVGADAIAALDEVEWLIDACRPADLEADDTEDVLYFAGLELRSSLDPLTQSSTTNEQAAVLCARVLGTAVRTMVTVEREMCRVFGGEPKLGWALEPGVALETRQAYSAFRGAIVSWGRFDGSPSAELVQTRLEVGKAAIVALRESHVWPRFRMADRLEFLRIEDRIDRWRSTPGALAKDGASTWDDLVSFAELLEGINMRQELREFDRWIAGELLPFFEDCEDDEEVPPVVLDLGAELKWRNAEWEAIFAGPANCNVWQAALSQLAEG